MMEATIQSRLQRIFRQQTGRTAIEYRGRVISYGELDERAARIAGSLAAQGVPRRSFVGVFMEDRAELIACMLGIIRAGCVFLPLDPNYPAERTKQMLAATDARYVFADQEGRGQLAFAERDGVRLLDSLAAAEPVLQDDGASEDDPVYVYFTSGSTGTPKPIVGRNGSLLHFLKWEIEEFELGEGVRVSQFTPPCHDPFLRDVLVPLCAGGTVCIPDGRETVWNPNALTEWIGQARVQVIHCTPSLFAFFQQGRGQDGLFSDVRLIFLAGEKIPVKQAERWYDAFGERIQLVNLYGPTETTLAKCFHRMSPQDAKRGAIPVGKPIRGARAVIVDEQMRAQEAGVAGELLIRTPFRTLGYHNNPELNRAKFIPNPFSNDPNDLVYRTGDLARLLPDGTIELLGRLDRQIKIRGFRVELDEIEQVMQAHPDVLQALVVDREGSDGGKVLCAYLVPEAPAQSKDGLEDAVKQFVSSRLPDYMVPAHMIRLRELPVGANGKIDYKLLPMPGDEPSIEMGEAPRDAVEETLASIWQEILGVEKIGIDAKFNELGRHSLHMMSLIASVYQHFQVELPLAVIFEDPTIRALAAFIREQEPATEEWSIQPAPWREFYPVSSAQRRLLILNQVEEPHAGYNIPSVMIVEGPLDVLRFEAAFQELVRRHETLRTSFAWQHGDFVQIVQEHVTFAVEHGQAVEQQIEECVADFVRPFDLGCAPLMRVRLLKLSEERHLFLFDIHHIVADGLSMAVLMEEFAKLYEGQPLPEPSIQYKDYVEWSLARESEEARQKQEAYWRSVFEDGAHPLTPLPLHTDFARSATQSYEGDVALTTIDAELTEQLSRLARKWDCSLYMLLLAAYSLLLARLAGGAEDVTVGTPVSGRKQAEAERLIGMFVNTVALRTYPSADKPFEQFVREVRAQVLAAFEQQEFPFEQLVDLLDVPRDLSRHPLFDTMFNYLDVDYESKANALTDIRIVPLEMSKLSAKFDLSFQASKAGGVIALSCIYKTSLYRRSTVEYVLGEYVHLLRGIVAEPGLVLEAFDVFDRRRLPVCAEAQPEAPAVEGFEEWPAEWLEQPIGRRFETVAARYPEHAAVKTQTGEITYKALNERANQVARMLAGSAERAALLFGHDIEMVVGVLGALKAGVTYVPLDPEFPLGRLQAILEDAETSVLLTDRAHAELANALAKEASSPLAIRLLEEADGSAENPEHDVSPHHPAYLLYTSGSTGTPKGVVQTHRNVLHFSRIYSNRLKLHAADRLTLFSTYCFDAAVMDLYGALLNGAALYPCSVKTDRIGNVTDWLRSERVTVFHSVPSLFRVVAGSLADSQALPDVRVVVMGGEPLYQSDVEAYKRVFSDGCLLVNGLGPTESTVTLQHWMDKRSEVKNHRVPVGRAVEETQVLLVKETGREAAVFETGELVYRSDYLALGYWKRPEETAHAFSDAEGGGREFRSGDFGRCLPDGTIEYAGRQDGQVKLRGYRIELGEIESALLAHPQVAEAAAVLADGTLCAAVVTRENVSDAEMRAHLQKRLPGYMVPDRFAGLHQLPKTLTGKINRLALPELFAASPAASRLPVPPETETEAMLVQVFEQVLGTSGIGIDDNFFAIGGNSLLTIAVEVEVERLLNAEDLNIAAQMMTHSTIRELAVTVEAHLEGSRQA